MVRIGAICGECHKYYHGESCPECVSLASGNTVNVQMDIQPHFNRGLGEHVSSRSDYRAKLKEKGLVEVGNEKKYVDPARQRKAREKQIDKNVEGMRPEAYKMLDRVQYAGRPQWN